MNMSYLKIIKAFTVSRDPSSCKKTIKKRSISITKNHHSSKSQYRFEVNVERCKKRNCRCNITGPIKSIKSPKNSYGKL